MYGINLLLKFSIRMNHSHIRLTLNDMHLLKCTGTSTLLFEMECLYTVLRVKP